MHYTELYCDAQGISQFRQVNLDLPHGIDMGDYSDAFSSSAVIFWSYKAGVTTDWHTAPQTQFVILLSGRIAIESASEERREFSAGDILLANNLLGQGHRTITLEDGHGLLIPKEALGERLQLLMRFG
jgi:quercetin dioxygenase-like cupin family protein